MSIVRSDVEFSNYEIAEKLCKHFGKDPRECIELVDDRPFNDCRYAIDSTKLHRLGWKPLVSFERGLDYTIKWYLENKEHWPPATVAQVLVAHPRMGVK